MKNKLIRLSKIISHAGVCSRKQAEVLIKNGEVMINDRIFREFVVEVSTIKSIKVKEKVLNKQPIKLWLFNIFLPSYDYFFLSYYLFFYRKTNQYNIFFI